MPKKRRVFISRVVGNQVMTSADLERLHKYMLEIEGIDHISDEMRAVTCLSALVTDRAMEAWYHPSIA